MDVRRPKQKAKRNIKRSTIALDDYMFDRKMQSLYYGAKPKSDDLPKLLKLLRSGFKRTKKELRNLPHTVKTAPKSLSKAFKKNPVRFLLGGLAAAILGVFIIGLLNRPTKTPAGPPVDKAKTGTSEAIPLNQTPEFSVLLPQGKTAKDVGGFARVSPSGAPSAYAYRDTVNDVDFLVTQQLLPETMKKEPSKEVEKLAISYNATQSVKTEKAEFFIGTNTNGQQSVITYTKSLLILIKTSGKLSNERWQSYIEDLK